MKKQDLGWRLPPLTSKRWPHYEAYVHTALRSHYGRAGWAWVEIHTGTQVIEPMEVAYSIYYLQFLAFHSFISHLPAGAEAVILTTSWWAAEHFDGHGRFDDPRLRPLLKSMHKMIQDRDLRVEVRWIDVYHNLATGLLAWPNRKTSA